LNEAIPTYVISALCVIMAVGGYFFKDMDELMALAFMGFAVFLTFERDLLIELLAKLVVSKIEGGES
ncbi:MAG: hypothetical protein ACOC4Y_01020, partial [bacterium]